MQSNFNNNFIPRHQKMRTGNLSNYTNPISLNNKNNQYNEPFYNPK